jgi:hypothetical protein
MCSQTSALQSHNFLVSFRMSSSDEKSENTAERHEQGDKADSETSNEEETRFEYQGLCDYRDRLPEEGEGDIAAEGNEEEEVEESRRFSL